MTPKAFYKNYLADDTLLAINEILQSLIESENPKSVFEFGCGSGKNLVYFQNNNVVNCGLDVSPQNIIKSHYHHGLPFLIIGDEAHLGFLTDFDVAFTCSVLDHILDIDYVINNLKRMANVVYLAETNDVPGEFYFPHDYESYGFEKIPDFNWTGDDGAVYYIWKWVKITVTLN